MVDIQETQVVGKICEILHLIFIKCFFTYKLVNILLCKLFFFLVFTMQAFTTVLNGGFSWKSEWQRASLGLQDSSKYSSWF